MNVKLRLGPPRCRSWQLHILNSFTAIMVVALCLTTSCKSDEPCPFDYGEVQSRPILLTEAEIDASTVSNRFGWRLLEQCSVGNTDNVVLSPISANICLSIVANATGGNSQAQLLNALGFDDMTHANSLNKKLAKEICTLDHNVTLSLANSLWYDADINPKQDFMSTLKDNYNIESFVINPPTFSTDVNDWCKKQTNGLIPKLLDEGTLKAFAMLNAIYFKGEWNKAFGFDKKHTYKGTFNNLDGTTSYPEFMIGTTVYPYIKTDKWRAVSIPFGGMGFRYTVILPNKDCSIVDCMASIINKEPATSTYTARKLNLKMPKFKMDQETDLINVLKQMGITDIFSEAWSNFSNMTDQDIVVDMVKQRVAFEINEEGAEGAAVTVVGGIYTTAVGDNPPQIEDFIVDRSFIFMVSEHSTGAILFLGLINKFTK